MSSKGLKKEIPEYERFEYDRAYVTKSEVIDLVNEVLDLKQSDMSRFVVDGKITPVVVLNDYNYDNYVKKVSWNLGLPALADIHFCAVDDFGNSYFYVHGDSVISYNVNGVVQSSFSAYCQDFTLGFGFLQRHFFARDLGVGSFIQHWYKGVLKHRIELAWDCSPWSCSPSGRYFIGCRSGDDDVELWEGKLG